MIHPSTQRPGLGAGLPAGWSILAGLLLLKGCAAAQVAPPFPNEAQPQGALTGASVFLSAGHGWVYNDRLGRWNTQRGLINGIIEDHSNAETVNQYLVEYLRNAGASVYTAREVDLNHHEVIVETSSPDLELEGPWTRGWHDRGARNRDYYTTTTTADPEKEALAWFTPDIPEPGRYAVYAWYAPPTEGEAARDARFRIHHAGGVTTWTQDLNRDYRTWKYLGHYWFDAGKDRDRASVAVSNMSAEPGRFVVADAIRFGGGMSDAVVAGTRTGRPRFEDSGLYHTRMLGYDPSSDSRGFNAVRSMPLWAEWEAEPWQMGRSVYLSWHTNASGTSDARARGLFTFVYSTESWDTTLRSFSGYPGGIELARSVQRGIIRSIHSAYDPDWRDGAQVGRWLGETNPESNNKMPAILVENGFHDNPRDAAYILDPTFRDLSAWGAYRGVLDYFVEHVDGFDTTTILPGRPRAPLAVQGAEEGTIRVSWSEPSWHSPGEENAGDTRHLGDRARSFMLHHSIHGRGFDNGTLVDFDSEWLAMDIQPGGTHFFQVRAVNKGGRSLPSETVAIRLPGSNDRQERILIVNGFQRLDRGMNLVEEPGQPYALLQERVRTREGYTASLDPTERPERGVGVERGILSKMNTFDYVVEHGRALEAAGFGFESASVHAVASGEVPLSGYDAVVWILGKERDGTTFDETTRPLVAEYLGAGGNLFVSGADLAHDLFPVEEGNGFLEGMLKVRYVDDRAPSHSVGGVEDSIFAGLGGITFGETASVYPVDTADRIRPVGGGVAALVYQGDDGPLDHAAAVTVEGGAYRTVMLAFPFESITSAGHRAEVMTRAMTFLLDEGEAVASAP